MVVTDLDGTLLDTRSRLSEANHAALLHLGEAGVLRVIATGRSLHSARLVLDAETPVDYLAVSSGAGIVHWPTGRLVRHTPMVAADTARVCARLEALDLDFMVQEPVPRSHCFVYRRSGTPNPDFERRIALHPENCGPADDRPDRWMRPACHVVAIHPRGDAVHEQLAGELGGAFTVIRTTSPLDGRSVWIEVLPGGVAKSRASAWIATEHDIGVEQVVAVGNDTNDLDLLEWAGRSYVVANATASMRTRWPQVASNDADGFGQVAQLALG